jgi:succinate dehydrogenase / fumarate reductase cytochrome b subunit
MGPQSYAAVRGLLSGPLGFVAMFGFSASFFFHLANGIRHLCWDAGYGFDRDFARLTGWFAIVAAAVLTALFWVGVLA